MYMEKNYLSNFKIISKIPWILIPIILVFSLYQYITIIRNFEKEKEKTEKYILKKLYLIDEAYAMFEKVLQIELEKNMSEFLLAYEINNNDVSKINLEDLRSGFSKDIDLYIIDKNNIILYSTFKDDIHLDFNKWENMRFFLDRVRSTLNFEPQRITVETATGLLKKYVYQSTPDRNYIFQLGLSSESILKYVDKLEFRKISRTLSNANKNIDNIRILHLDGWERSFDNSVKPEKELSKIVEKVTRNKKAYELRENNKIKTYIYTNFQGNDNFKWVVEITYNRKSISIRIFKNSIISLAGILITSITLLAFSSLILKLESNSALYTLVFMLLLLIPLDIYANNINLLENHNIMRFLYMKITIIFILTLYIIKKHYSLLDKALSYDEITLLANRNSLIIDIKNLINKEILFTLIVINIENIREIFNIIGHSKGDLILKKIADYILEIKGYNCNYIYNSYSLNFEIILLETDLNKLKIWIKDFIYKLEGTPIKINEHQLHLKSIMGLSISSKNQATIKEAYQALDFAIKNNYNYYIYDKSLNMIFDDTHLISQTKKALLNNEFYIEYQPKLNIKNNKIEELEALIRWKHPKLGIIPPNKFIPTLEKNNLIKEVTFYVFRQVMKDIKYLEDSGFKLNIAVNVCPKDLIDDFFKKKFIDLLEESKLEMNRIGLEITENELIKEKDKIILTLSILKIGGVKIFLDDFGTGYSSLSYLSNLPISCVKLDKSFVKDLMTTDKKISLIKNIIRMCHTLKINIIAEGVEDKKTFELLKNLGCEEIQGYFFAKAMNIKDLLLFLNKFNGLNY